MTVPETPTPPTVPGATMKALEALEARVVLLESTLKDQALAIAQLKAAAPTPAPAKTRAGLLKDR